MWLLKALTVYLCLCAGMFLVQRKMIFYPDRRPSDLTAIGAQPFPVTTADGLNLRGWYLPPPQPGGMIAVLFHGNAGNTNIRAFKAAPFVAAGMGFLFAEYRGYGGNPGKPSAEGFYHDARAYLDALRDRRGGRPYIILYGESLGTGVVTKMAMERRGVLAGVVLETPYTSLPALAQGIYPFLPAWPLVRDRFNNIAHIPEIEVPVLILHGRRDEIVPYRHAERLMARAGPNVRLVTFDDGRHNDLPNHGVSAVIAQFVTELKSHYERE